MVGVRRLGWGRGFEVNGEAMDGKRFVGRGDEMADE
jgi:hypothetical protein